MADSQVARMRWSEYVKEFYREIKDIPEEVGKKIAFERGKATGQILVQQMNIKGHDANSIATLLKAILEYEPTATIEVKGNKIYQRNKGFCPVMATSLALNVPWEKFCRVIGWPFFHGVASAVNTHIIFKPDSKWRLRGDPYCEHIIEVEQT